jgi:two-component system sensor kinase FixL
MVRRVAPEQELLDLNELIPQALSFAKGQLTANQIVLQKSLQPGLPAVLGDKIQLQQVVLNLVLNAVHALTLVEGSREILVQSRPTAPSEVTVTVQDSGIGINQEQSERMFVPFYSTRKGGLGLGLSISRTIIEGHGGKLWVTQNEGKGASFHFMLPIADSATNPP